MVGDHLSTPTAAETTSTDLAHVGLSQTSEHSRKGEEEKSNIPIEGAAASTDLQSLPKIERKGTGRDFYPASLQKTRSYGDGHGFTVFGKEEKNSNGQNNEHDADKEFEVKWDGDDDPMNPRNMSHGRKWVIVLIVSAGSTCVTCTSSMYASTYAQLMSEFHVSRVVATLGLSLFVMGLGISPMFLGPLSEFYGRRPIYIVSFIFFLIWLIPCAVAQNIGTELVARFIDGMAGSAFLSVAGGTVGDMFKREHLQLPMMVFTASPFIGPPVGPIVAGFINQYTNWYVAQRIRIAHVY